MYILLIKLTTLLVEDYSLLNFPEQNPVLGKKYPLWLKNLSNTCRHNLFYKNIFDHIFSKLYDIKIHTIGMTLAKITVILPNFQYVRFFLFSERGVSQDVLQLLSRVG